MDVAFWFLHFFGLWFVLMTGYPCCCGAACTCTNCEDNAAPCEVDVVLGGSISDGTCTECLNYLATWTLTQAAAGDCFWSYTFTGGDPSCTNIDRIYLEAFATNVRLEVSDGTTDDSVWTKNYGANADCDAWSSESLTWDSFQSSNTQCTWNSVTAALTAA